MQIKREEKGVCPARSPSPVVPCSRSAVGSTRLQEASSSAIGLAIRFLVCKRASTGLLLPMESPWHFCCLQAFLLSRESAFHGARREARLLQISGFWIQGLLRVCERPAIWINHRTVRLVSTKSSKTEFAWPQKNQSTDLGFSFSIPQLAHETSGPAARILNTVIS